MAKSSLEMYPSGYSAGKLYSQRPTNGVGDFTVDRDCEASRLNKDGNIEFMANNVPRLDYSGGGCPVLLTEPQSTNLALWSEDFSNSIWLDYKTTHQDAQLTAPNGLNEAVLISQAVGDTSAGVLYQTMGSLNGTYILSVFLKKGSSNWAKVSQTINISSLNGAWFDLENGVTGSKGAFITDSLISDEGNGWYRCSIIFTGTSTGRVIAIQLSDNDNSDVVANDGSTNVYAWGAQLEQQSYPTSYITTNGSTVVRFADIITVDTSLITPTPTEIIETIDGVEQSPITTIPPTYQISEGNINSVIMN